MSFTTSIVFTTIFDPVALDDYCANLKASGQLESTTVYVIPDLKTPPACRERCERLGREGLKVVCPSLEEQEAFLRKVGFDPHLIPCNTDNRRNAGYLMALASGSDLIISIDDDNHCRGGEDFVGKHAVCLQGACDSEVVEAESGWFNICSLLELEPANLIYPRGFPYYARHQTESPVLHRRPADVHMNAGLWLNDPDVDGMTWLVAPTHSTGFSGRSVVLGRGAWTPVNTQNTGMRRDVMASYYYFRMKYPMGGMSIDRFGDIYSGYFAQACVKARGGLVRAGDPVADHRRNAHNFFADAGNEWGGIMVLEDLLPWLTSATIQGADYPEAFTCISELLEDSVERFSGKVWTEPVKAYFHQMAYYMRRWAKVCRSLL